MPDRNAFLEKLKKLLPAAFEEVCFCYGLPPEHIPKPIAPVEHAILLIRHAEATNALQKLQRGLEQALGLPSDDIDISRLPKPTAELVGRKDELKQLDAALFDAKKHLAILVAGGGVGKSALSFAWLKAMQPEYHGFDKVFAWSFYSQGSHDTQTSAAEFFQEALPFFGVSEIPQHDVDKGRALARLLRKQKILLILDGLEPLQHPPPILDGELKDKGLQALFEALYAHGAAGLALLSSRQPLVELGEWDAANYYEQQLDTPEPAPGGGGVMPAPRGGLRAFLFLLGLFDRPMGLLKHDALLKNADCALPLRGLDDLTWQPLERQLEQAGLLLKPQDWQKSVGCADEGSASFTAIDALRNKDARRLRTH